MVSTDQQLMTVQHYEMTRDQQMTSSGQHAPAIHLTHINH